LGVAVTFVLASAGSLSCPSVAGAASTVTVSGYVFRDLDNDGIRDANEPGVAGIRVHRNSGNGTPTATTGPDGHYTLSGLTPRSSGNLQVETGWFRSQCAKLACASGPGPDNDYKTANQFIQFPLSQVTVSLADVDVGLLPDWPGSSASAPAPVAGVVPANDVDVAARLSWVTSTCSDGTALICRPGDSYTVSAQLHNEGTTAVTGIQAALALPAGDSLATPDAADSVKLYGPASSPDITGLTVGQLDPDTHIVTMSFVGTLVPGGLIRVNALAIAGGTEGTPGCVRGHPTAACPTAEPQGAPLVLRITHIDQSGDPDSFGPGCDAATPVQLCPTGIHDKQVEPDEVDPVGHNMDASIGTDPSYDLLSRVDLLSPVPADGWHAGAPVTWRMSAFNEGPAVSGVGWRLTLLFPPETQPAVPTANAMRTCLRAKLASGVWSVTCTGRGPLSPAVTSVAVDVTATIGAGVVSGQGLPVLAYVAPAAGQDAETVPLGTPPTDPATPAEDTATDNDASATIVVG
jgi:SdrD B-like domain